MQSANNIAFCKALPICRLSIRISIAALLLIAQRGRLLSFGLLWTHLTSRRFSVFFHS